MKEWVNLRDYIRELLLDGKRSQHPDFEVLFRIYGEEKITKMAKEILKEEKARDVEKESV